VPRRQVSEIRDHSFENQRYRASGLNLVVTAIILWNTVYLERAIQALRDTGQDIDEKLLPHLSPLGWGSTLLAITSGGNTSWSNRASSGRYGWSLGLSVRFFLFRERRPLVTPQQLPNGLADVFP
jgi:hypothetical protein